MTTAGKIPGAMTQRVLPSGLIVAVIPLTYGRARLTIGYDVWGYDRGY